MSKKKPDHSEKLKYWHSVIKDFKRSGLSQSEYARKHKLSAKYISKYYNQFKQEAENKSIDFISVETNIINNKNLKLSFVNGSVLEIPNNSNLDYLAQVIKLLQEHPSC